MHCSLGQCASALPELHNFAALMQTISDSAFLFVSLVCTLATRTCKHLAQCTFYIAGNIPLTWTDPASSTETYILAPPTEHPSNRRDALAVQGILEELLHNPSQAFEMYALLVQCSLPMIYYMYILRSSLHCLHEWLCSKRGVSGPDSGSLLVLVASYFAPCLLCKSAQTCLACAVLPATSVLHVCSTEQPSLLSLRVLAVQWDSCVESLTAACHALLLWC